jgi:uncharacterized protein (DUF2237 family)
MKLSAIAAGLEPFRARRDRALCRPYSRAKPTPVRSRPLRALGENDAPYIPSTAGVRMDLRTLRCAGRAPRDDLGPVGQRPGPGGHSPAGHTGAVADRNVLGGELELCGTDPLTGFFRDGWCRAAAEDRGSHTICAVVTSAFLEHQRQIGNDLITPMPEYQFAGLAPGDRWCVTALNWLRAHESGAAAYVVLACTHERALDTVSIAALRQHAVDVPPDPGTLGR